MVKVWRENICLSPLSPKEYGAWKVFFVFDLAVLYEIFSSRNTENVVFVND